MSIGLCLLCLLSIGLEVHVRISEYVIEVEGERKRGREGEKHYIYLLADVLIQGDLQEQ